MARLRKRGTNWRAWTVEVKFSSFQVRPLFSAPQAVVHSFSLSIVPDDSPTDLVLYPSLSALFDSDDSSAKPPSTMSLPFYPSTSLNPEQISSIVAGASHFLILTSPSSRLFWIGDNRYGQLGVPHSSTSITPKLNRIDTFDGIRIAQISAGAFHSVVLTEGGEVYLFGSDKEGQCGGNGGGWEPTTNGELGEIGDGQDEEASEIVQVCAAGESTFLRTRAGELWVCGASECFPAPHSLDSTVFLMTCTVTTDHSGQLGVSAKEISMAKFRGHPSFGSDPSSSPSIGRARNVVCSRWTTYVEIEQFDEEFAK